MNNDKTIIELLSLGRFAPRPTSGPRLAVAHDAQEQLFQRGCRILDLVEISMMPLDRCANFGLALFAQTRRSDLRNIAHFQQTIDAAQLLELPLMQDRDSIAYVLDICQ